MVLVKGIISKLEKIEVARGRHRPALHCVIRDHPWCGSLRIHVLRGTGGKPLKLFGCRERHIRDYRGIEQNGLGVWLDDVRRYHQGTFQHCLLVTGVAVGFA